jgi:ATP-binding cassette subfamily B protein
VPERVPYRTTFLRLLGFLRPYRTGLIVSAVLAILAQCAQIAIALLLIPIVHRAVSGHDRSQLWPYVAALVGIGVLKAAMLVGRRFISGRQALAVEYDLRNTLYARLVRLSYSFYDRHQVGQILSRATVDLQSVRFFLGYGLIFFFQHVFTVVSVTAVLFFLEWKLALIVLAISPLLAGVAYRYSHVAHPLLRDVQQTMADVATVAEENVVGVHVVKAFAQEGAEAAKFARRTEIVFKRAIQANRQSALYTPLMAFLPSLAIAGVLLLGGRMVVHHQGHFGIPQLVTFNFLLLQLVSPLRQLGTWIGQAQRATASGERIFELIDEPEDIASPPDARPLPAGNGHVRFEGVSFGYAPDRLVLEDVDLDLEAGSTVALIGQTGSGKTTLASLVPRFYDPTRGRVTIDGADVRSLELGSLRSAIGVVSQEPFLFSATARENIAFGRPDATHAEIEEAARRAQAHDFVTRLPEGYDTMIGERGITLSGGQRQRIAIARALLLDPRILILDDATASVDATTEAQIRLGLRAATEDRTTIIIAHRLSTIALADELVVLDRGRIAARGTHDDLIAQSAVYREIYEHGLLEREFIERLEARA